MGDIMLLIERWIATMPFQTSRRKIQDSNARQVLAGGGDEEGEGGARGKSEAEINDVRRRNEGKELKNGKSQPSAKRGATASLRPFNDAGHLTTLALDRCVRALS